MGDLLASPRYLPRLTEKDAKPLERALAGATLFDDGVVLDGVLVEAAYAVREPAALDHLRDQRVPLLVDPQSLRMSSSAYLSNSRLGALPYVPATPLTPASSDGDRDHFVADALRFQQKVGATAYLVPSVPLRDEPGWAELHHDITGRAVAANGREVDGRELVALVAPGPSALKKRRDFVSRLQDLPIAAVLVQPLSLDPTKDSVDKLARVWSFCHELEEAGLPVMAGRVGAFGLVLQALGVTAFESGIGAAERYSWADQVRPPTPKDDEKESGGGGAGKRIYVGQLLTTLPAKVVEALLRLEGVRGRLVCNLACCRLAGHSWSCGPTRRALPVQPGTRGRAAARSGDEQSAAARRPPEAACRSRPSVCRQARFRRSCRCRRARADVRPSRDLVEPACPRGAAQGDDDVRQLARIFRDHGPLGSGRALLPLAG